jgi:2-methylisocitrate lyase-like PEP mutase family enzyme
VRDGATARADRLRALHVPGRPLVLVNVWDAASARTVAAVPGCAAIATASWSVAAAHGLPDGEVLARERMIDAVAQVAAAVELPVTADLEAGYGATPEAVGETIALAIEAGAVGGNLEDGTGDGPAPLRPLEESVARVAAAVRAGDPTGVPFVVNARTDVFLAGGGDVEEALARGRAYAAAGAACVFVPGVRDPATIERLVTGIDAPVSVLAGAGSPSLAELAELGVARVSIGPGGMGVALAALGRAAEAMLSGNAPWSADLGFRPPSI